ncbi:fungal-specific transcription factor domain-containing protein [Xylogone sp. PMI_703]|nr:fungal-specific transcription factor domain-containing protein [Xylogone sp. PMI_703]
MSRRARAACTLCRWRKVRCDATHGQRCSNCIFEDVQCVFTPKQRRRKTRDCPEPSASSTAEPVEPAEPATDEPSSTNPDQTGIQSSPDKLHHDPPVATTVAREDGHLSQASLPKTSVESNDPTGAISQEPNDVDWGDAINQSLPSPVSPNASIGISNAGTSYSEIEKSLTAPMLPYFVKSFPHHLTREDIEYLLRKGALTIPEPELRDALIRSFIEFVHPCLPVIDLESFQASIEDPEQNGTVSFPLFQAIMFAGAAWVDIKLLRKLGYLTRRAARKAFYLKARLLYDSDYEEDRLCIVQTLVLLTLWWEGPDEQKDGWYWSGLSLSVARTIGLNRTINNRDLDPRLRRLRRQVWWCCVMRDTIASFGLNRAPRIADSDHDISVLTLDDFEIYQPYSPETRWALPRDFKRQRQLALICIRMSKICTILSKVLQLAYNEDPGGRTGTLYSNQELNASEITPPPAKPQIDIQKLSLCEEELRTWKEETPEELLHQSPTPSVDSPNEQAPLLHRAMLSMMYFTTLLSLHRPCVLTSSVTRPGEQHTAPVGSDTSRQMIRYAAALTNKLVMDLYQADLMRLLPATGISSLIPVSISHVFDMKSGDENIRREGSQRLEECKQALRELADAHIAAEWAVNFLSFVASQVKLTSNNPRRRIPGMIRGEIKWNVQTQAQSTEIASAPQRNFEPPQKALTSRISGTDASESSQAWALQYQDILHCPTVPSPSDHAPSPDNLSNMINFPEIWLDFTASVDNIMDINLGG